MTRNRRLRRSLLGVGVVVLLLAVVTAWQAWAVRSALKGARLDLESVARQLDAGNAEAAASAAERAQDASARADFHSHTPAWWLAQYLPLVGDDVTAVREVSAAAHDMTQGVVTPMVRAGFTPAQFRPVDGRVALPPLRRAATFLDDAAPRVATIDGSISELDTRGLIGAVRQPVEDLELMLRDAARISRAGAVASDLLPGMLGADGERTYLIAFQNNAEARSTGGLLGSFGVLRTKGGRMSFDGTVRPTGLENGRPVAPLTAEERLVFTKRMAVFARNANFTPDFPRTAELLSAFWERSGRAPLDGVLSLDPVALSYLIDYTGPITLDDGTVLTRDNTVEVLLRDVYEEPDPRKQDRFFDRAAGAIFETALSASGSVEALISALSRGVDERRVAVWSAHADEQRRLAGEDVANELPGDTGGPEIGAYLIDSAADKLSYYLHSDVSVTPSSCSSAGVQKLSVKWRLHSTAPRGGLPDYVIGGGVPGKAPGVMRHTTYLFAPAGGRIEDEITLDGQDAFATPAELNDRPVAFTTFDIAPGETRTLEYVVYSGANQHGDTRVLSTPLADGSGGEAFAASACD